MLRRSKEVEIKAEKEAIKLIEGKFGWKFKPPVVHKRYDLKFEDSEGNEKYVEVKGRIVKSKGEFTNTFVDESEWKFARENKDKHFFIFIELDKNSKLRDYKILKVEDFTETNDKKVEYRFKKRNDVQLYWKWK
ncbi:MAG: protein NO VEIN domain-containing protein [Nitrososphaerales archaeon]